MPEQSTTHKNHNNNSILDIDETTQYRTVDELMEHSRPNSIYYTFLILSTLIVTAGLLLDNSPIVIGGMVVTPVLTPLLVIGLGLAIGDIKSIRREVWLVVKSFVIIITTSLVLGFVLGTNNEVLILENNLRTAVLYFVVALSAGMVGTFAWSRKEMAITLPGVAIAVSLVPPLSLIGIGLSLLNGAIVQFYLYITIFNLLGIVVGSLLVFSLQKFHQAGDELKEKTAEIELQEQQEKVEKELKKQE